MKRFHFSLILILSICLTGCGAGDGRPADMPRLFPTTITIVQDGVPLAGASVVLIPDDGSRDWYVSGATNESGVAEMVASSRWSGAPNGQYRVIVRKFESDASRIPPLPDDADEAARAAHEFRTAEERLNTYTLVESIFTDPARTPLTLTVDGVTNETLDVGAAVRNIVR